MGFCKTCIHTEVCLWDKNIFGENIYVAPHPLFFDDEYKKKSWENYLKSKEQGFPCDKFLEIIRCKDCKWSIMDKVNGVLSCWTGRGVDDNDYCSNGERREDADT